MAGTRLGQPGPAGGAGSLWGNQDVQTVKDLRLGVGVIGILLPIALIAGNRIMGDKVIIPASMSGSYYTSTRNLFVGSLCALGVFLIFYRHTMLQDLCTSFAGVCAVIVAFSPTAPTPPNTEPAWINYLHHSAAGVLIFTLGVFCLVVFTEYDRLPAAKPRSMADRLADWVSRLTAWLKGAWESLRQGKGSSLYLICGVLVLISGALGVYTGLWPTSWSTGWPSLYLFEAIAVFSFGVAWIAAGLEDNATVDQQGHRPVGA
jgi:hypothetical protein